VVLFSGGEPLLRPEVFEIAGLFRERAIDLHLHTSGVLLERFVAKVASTFSRVIVSLDSAEERGYRQIRGVAALPNLERAVAKLRDLAPRLPVSARMTVHRLNYREIPRLVEHARAMSFDSVSMLCADMSARAFGRTAPLRDEVLMMDRDEVVEFADIVERLIVEEEEAIATGFIAESPARLRSLPQYFAALLGLATFPPVSCNAPYVSVVVEADGTVRPCFFQPPIGSIRQTPLSLIVRRNLPAFRSEWTVNSDATCRRCVCSLNANWRSAPWQ
jgi:MoaA/NifB/PqqE/SkfB family radical SAM enzyme